MRQIDNMTPDELEQLKIKGIVPLGDLIPLGDMIGAEVDREMNKTQSPFTPLHPTLKACKCGQVFTRRALYKHLAQQVQMFTGETPQERTASWKRYFAQHGEVPLNIDDPRVARTPSEQAASEAS